MRQFFLVLERDAGATKHRVRVAKSLADAIDGWLPATRVSPLFTTAELPQSGDLPDCELLLLSLAHPRDIEELIPAIPFWLSLGMYNVVVPVTDTLANERLRAWQTESGRPVERWTLRNSVVESVETTVPSSRVQWMTEVARAAAAEVSGELAESMREYCPLMASGAARASQFFPEIAQDLEAIHTDVLATLDELAHDPGDDRKYEVLGDLTTLNAGLSRFTSQAFSGTSPVSETECHYWVHSLLGTGLANVALWRFCYFIIKILAELRIPNRVEHYAELPVSETLEARTGLDEFWYQSDFLDAVRLTPEEIAEPLVPLVTCFSGRDGFKSTLQSLSAPLAVIGACNSLRWTMLTLTHEIAHLFVRGALGALYPTREQARDAYHLLNRTPANMLEAIRRYLVRTIAAMQEVEEGGRIRVTEGNIGDLLERWHDDVEEMMVHVFDFLYFHSRGPDRYIRAVWLSWSTIPNIGSRVPEYVLRTMLAVLVLDLRRGGEIESAAKDRVYRVLDELRSEGHDSLYIQQALEYIDTQWAKLQLRLVARRGLVRIVQTFLFSDTTATRMLGETRLVGGQSETAGYPHRIGVFSVDGITNPLRFTEHFTRDGEPDAGNSLWMLYMLALNTRDPNA